MAAAHEAGSVSSFADLQTALETFLTAHGWAAAAGPAAGGGYNAQRLWTKGDLVVRVAVQTDNTAIHFRGATGVSGSASTGDAPQSVKIASPTVAPMTFPVDYEFYWNDTPEEVYVVISYNGNRYQHAHFGESDVPEIGGTGMHIGASYTGDRGHTDANAVKMYMSASNDSDGGGAYGIMAYAGIQMGFFQHYGNPGYGAAYVHCGLEGTSWKANNFDAAGGLASPLNARDLMTHLPSVFNESDVLVNIYAILRRTDNVFTPIVNLRHARVLRLDNRDVESIITYGSDQWKVYPWYARNTTQRNGVAWATGAEHSGTFGLAFRYPGA